MGGLSARDLEAVRAIVQVELAAHELRLAGAILDGTAEVTAQRAARAVAARLLSQANADRQAAPDA